MKKPVLFALALGMASALAFASCTPQYPQCETDKHCADHNEFCVQGQCQECGADNHCKDGFICRENACVPEPECTSDDDCSGCMTCQSEKCVPQCMGDSQCGSAQKCADGCCVQKPKAELGEPCESDADCREDYICYQKRCADRSAAQEQMACQLQVVSFDFNDFSLTKEAREVLNQNLECLKTMDGVITLSGHADERGTEEYNLHLGEKRANTVKRYLSKMGLSERRLKAISFGEERPVDPGHNESAWSANRRVELSE